MDGFFGASTIIRPMPLLPSTPRSLELAGLCVFVQAILALKRSLGIESRRGDDAAGWHALTMLSEGAWRHQRPKRRPRLSPSPWGFFLASHHFPRLLAISLEDLFGRGSTIPIFRGHRDEQSELASGAAGCAIGRDCPRIDVAARSTHANKTIGTERGNRSERHDIFFGKQVSENLSSRIVSYGLIAIARPTSLVRRELIDRTGCAGPLHSDFRCLFSRPKMSSAPPMPAVVLIATLQKAITKSSRTAPGTTHTLNPWKRALRLQKRVSARDSTSMPAAGANVLRCGQAGAPWWRRR